MNTTTLASYSTPQLTKLGGLTTLTSGNTGPYCDDTAGVTSSKNGQQATGQCGKF